MVIIKKANKYDDNRILTEAIFYKDDGNIFLKFTSTFNDEGKK